MGRICFYLGLTLTVLVGGFGVNTRPTRASGSQMIRILKSPLGRGLFHYSTELRKMSRLVLGKNVSTENDIQEFVQTLIKKQKFATVRQLESELVHLDQEFKIWAQASASALPVSAPGLGGSEARALRTLSRRWLSFEIDAHGALHLQPQLSKTVFGVEGFFESLIEIAAKSKSLAGQDLRGAFVSGAKTDINLTGLDMRFCDLSGLRLERGIFSRAELRWADLRGVDLKHGELMATDLRFANLEKTNLSEAILLNADLRGARLKKAQLNYADLRGAKLEGADLSEVFWSGVGFKSSQGTTANLAGATYDARTRLPFDDLTAQKLGMIKLGN